MNYYNEIKNELINNEINKKVKNYSINKSDLNTYYNVGKILSEAGKHYGDGIVKEYSQKLKYDLNKNYSIRLLYRMLKYYNFVSEEKLPTLSAKLSWSHYDEILKFDDVNKIAYYIKISEQQSLSVNRRTLFRMKQFYNVFSNEKVTTMLTQLSWSHYLLLLPLDDYNEILYYINISKTNNLTQRQLQERIKDKEYKRLPIESRKKLIKNEVLKPNDLIPNPVRIKNSNNYKNISEKILQHLILEDIPSFLKELGNGFTFIDNEYPIKFGNRYNYIDLLLLTIHYLFFIIDIHSKLLWVSSICLSFEYILNT